MIEELGFLVLAIDRFFLMGPSGVQMAFGNLTSAFYRYDAVVKASWAKRLGAILAAAAVTMGAVVDADDVGRVVTKRAQQVMDLISPEEPKLIEDKSMIDRDKPKKETDRKAS